MTKTVTMHDQEFEVSEPYAEGHKITEIEAKVLNQVRAENINNNYRKKVKNALKGDNPEEAMKAIRKEYAEYDKNYVFVAGAARGSRTSLTPLQRECNRIGRQYLVNALKQNDTTLKAYTEANGKEAVDAKIAEIAEQEAVVKMAKANLKAAENKPELDIAV